MNSAEFESLVRNAVERVLDGGRIEDSRFEAKAEMPTSLLRIGERLAGHANASLGQPIIWLVGLDEDAHGFGPEPDVDLAEVMPQLEKLFDQRELPELTRDHRFHFDDGSVLALEFDTSYPPYVVNRQTGDDWAFSVPWRYGTRVRAARRDDIRRLLARQLLTPAIRPLSLSMELQNDWFVIGGRLLFTLPTGSPSVLLPDIDMHSSIGTEKTRAPLDLEWGEVRPPKHMGGRPVLDLGGGRERHDSDAHATDAGVYVGSIGSVAFGAKGNLITGQRLGAVKRAQKLTFRFEARVANSDSIARAEVPLKRLEDPARSGLIWEFDGN